MVEQDSMDDQSIQIAKDCQGLPDLAKDCQGNPKQIFSVPWRVEGKPSRGPCVCPGPGPSWDLTVQAGLKSWSHWLWKKVSENQESRRTSNAKLIINMNL